MTGKSPEIATPEAVREQIDVYKLNRIRLDPKAPSPATMTRYGRNDIGSTVLLTVPVETSTNVLQTPQDHPFNHATLWETAAKARVKYPEATVLIDFYDKKVMSYNGHQRWDEEPLISIAYAKAAAEVPPNNPFSIEMQQRQKLSKRLKKVWG